MSNYLHEFGNEGFMGFTHLWQPIELGMISSRNSWKECCRNMVANTLDLFIVTTLSLDCLQMTHISCSNILVLVSTSTVATKEKYVTTIITDF